MQALTHYLPTGRADRYAGPSSLYSNRLCWLLGRTSLTSHQLAVPTIMPAPPDSLSTGRADPLCRIILTPLQPAVLTVMPDPPRSLPTGRADHYDESCLLPSNRPCSPFCRTILTPLQPAMLAAVPDPLHFHSNRVLTPKPAPPHCLPTLLTVMPDPPHTLPIGGADRYAGPCPLHFSCSR